MSKRIKRIGEILETSELSIFTFFPENREIDPSKLKSIRKRMIDHGWEKGSYLLVNEKYQVIDGQHRLTVARELNIPVQFIIVQGGTMTTVCERNSGNHNWNIINHLDTYVKRGYNHYIKLDLFMKNFPDFRPTECMMLVKNSTGSSTRDVFETGNFETKNMDIAYQWGRYIVSLKPFFSKGYNKAIFVRALVRVLLKPDFSFEEFYYKVKLRPSSITMCGTVEQYVEMIESIYNYKRKTDNKINLRF
jgi:hypothetical protein